MRPFSRFRSSLTEACVREISSRNREDSFARSDVSLSCDERVSCDSVESEFSSSERSLAKSTFCVYVLRSASRWYHQSTIHVSQHISCIGGVPTHRPCYTSSLTLFQHHSSGQILDALFNNIIQHTHHRHSLLFTETLSS
jgi:hypothetical protein